MGAGQSRQYANIIVAREGTQITEETSIRVSRDFANKPVKTVARGFAGTVKGGPMMRVQIRNAVPAAGVEYDPGPDGASATPRTWTFIRGGQHLTAAMVVETDDTEHSVDNETVLNFDLVGPMQQWAAL